MKLVLLASVLVPVLALGTGCSDKTSFEQVPISGLPCAKEGQHLKIPMVMEAKHKSGTLRMTYAGGNFGGKPNTVSLEKDTETTLEIRFGQCRDTQCDKPEWIGGTQTVTVDTRMDEATLVVGVPGEHTCI